MADVSQIDAVLVVQAQAPSFFPSNALTMVDDRSIDDGLGIIRKLWDAGLAHRDIKPANLLVRDGHLLLIHVAFGGRPTPWRQAVDLANMMLCLALRASPNRCTGGRFGGLQPEAQTPAGPTGQEESAADPKAGGKFSPWWWAPPWWWSASPS
jgi:serine/threonine protein kinase